ncbi:hypothetical protein Poli38472_007554 [Pythium oligandrum]|uniref:ABC transporter domain-containing protein n=1 Tax=Pythium oligandrum TaxID=41045 RepID=A0A8K1CQD6_PYTOL|nr:hypothetical protein Poli38472_007554 [Pythium oligandrum]|eukprot:TMW67882.1 hypothetical protein Poli38472_007554 [Pythium oligandrum]
MQFGSSVVLMMDEISTGLDSAATYDIIKMERSIAKNLRKTVVIALLQPPPEVFDLFDDVMLLNDGYVVYHGPREKANDYFTDMGFVRPSHRDVADYLLDLGTDQQRQYEVGRPDGSAPPRTASEFASIFRKSSIHDEMMAYLEDPHDSVLLKDMDELLHLVPEFHQSFFASTKTLVKRDLTRMSRNMGFYKTHFFNMLMVALLNASVFWQFDPSNPQASLGVLQQFLVLLALMQTAQIPGFLYARAIFYRQRRANFYRSSSCTLGYLLCHLPVALGEAIVLGTTAYWMCGFVASASGFFIFLLMLFLHSTVSMIMCFALSALVSNVHIAKPVAMMGVVTSAVFCGFLITKDQIPDYLIWIFWLNPSAYALRTMVVNQYRNSEFDVCEYGGIVYCEKYGMQVGEYTLSLFAVDSAKGWVWYGIIYIIAVIVVFAWLSSLILEHYRYESTYSPSKGEGKTTKASDVDSTDSYGLVQTPRGGDTKLDIHPDSHRYRITPLTLAFRDLWYSVPDPANPKLELKLLKGISGFARPGTMSALMGSSGAGKTTLMDVIAGRKTGGSIQGEILLNGHPASALAIHRATGYCEQMDIHSEASTFREALTFSAFLRQSSVVPASLKYQSVEECLGILDLHSIADKTIRGSSLEQMKRLTIGVELAAQLSVLFLDEPTSGLDARSAKLVMDGVRKVANSGRTVVCTIHQPSTEAFMLFDSLLLLSMAVRRSFSVIWARVGSIWSSISKLCRV